VISGVATFGFWAETVEHKCEGMVSANDLAEFDDFVFNEGEYALVGRHGPAFCDGGQSKGTGGCRKPYQAPDRLYAGGAPQTGRKKRSLSFDNSHLSKPRDKKETYKDKKKNIKHKKR